MDKVLLDQRFNAYSPRVRITLGEHLLKWLDEAPGRGLRESTIASHQNYVGTYILNDDIADIQLDRLQARDIEGFLARLLTTPTPRRDVPLKPTTVRHIFYALRQALVMAKKAYGIPNVADDVTNVPTAKECKPPKPTIFTPSELKEFLNAARDHDLYPLWHLVAMTGIRRSEALGLKWTDVDLDGSRIWIQRAVTVVRGSLKVGPVKTYRSERPVALDPKTVSVLRSHREAQGKVKTALGSAYSDQGLVFCRADGGHLVPNRVSDSMTELCRSAGLPHVTVHGLRHTHASILLDAKENPKVVQERLGHESAAFTLSRYTHVLPGRDGEAASRFARTVELAPDFRTDDDHVD